MKRLSAYIALFLLLLLSCKEEQRLHYTIQGDGVADGTVFLLSTDEGNREISSIRSNGRFAISIAQSDTATLFLVLPDSRIVTLFAEPGVTATLLPDSTLRCGWSVKGTASQALHDSISRILDTTNDIAKQKKIIEEFTNKYPLSEVNIELFRRYLIDVPNPDNEYLRKATSKLGGALQDHRYFALAKKMLDKKTGDIKHRMFPSFNYTTIDSNKVNLGVYADKYLLVNIWATWDKESHKSIKTLRDMRKIVKSENFAILNISLDNDSARWKRAVTADSIIGDNVIDRRGMGSEILETFNIASLPYSVLVTPYKRISEYGLRLDSLAFETIDSLTYKHDNRNQKKKKNRR